MKKVVCVLLTVCLLLAVVPGGILSVGADDYVVADTEAVDPAPSSTATTTTTTSTTASTNQTQNNNPTSLSWSQVKAKMPANLIGSTVTFYNWNALTSITDAQNAVNAFTKDTGITVSYKVGNYSTYVTEITAMQDAGTAPDIVRMKDLNPAMMAMLQPLSNTGFDFSDAAWDQDVMSRYSYKGVAYAANMVNTVMQQPDVFFYNKILVSKYDLDDPYALWKQGQWTYDKFVEVCEAFKDEAGDGYTAFSPFKWQAFAQVQGSDFVLYTENGFKSNMEDAKLADGLRKMISMKEDGLAADSAYQRQSFEAGNVLFFHDAIIGARKTHFYYTSLKSAGSLGVVPLPQIGNSYTQLFAELEAYAVPIGAKNPTAVPYFLRYWLDADNYDVDKFFNDGRTLEVYNHCMEQENRLVTNNYNYVLTADSGFSGFISGIVNSSAGQIKSKLDANADAVESAVGATNLILDKLYVCQHSYDNDCDSTCNLCDATRTVPDHIYDNARDTTCNVCGAVRTLDRIAVTTKPSRLNYFEAKDQLDVTGGKVTLYYDNGTAEEIDLTAEMVSGFDNTIVGEQVLTVTHEGFTATYTVTVLDKDVAAFVVDDATARAGDTFTVAVRTQNNTGITSLKLWVEYDSNVLELTGIEQQDFVGGVFGHGPLTANPVAINWADSLSPNNTTDGVIALLTFTVKEGAASGDTAISLSYDPEDVYDQDFENVTFATVEGAVTVIEYISGDVNGDGKVNNKDLGLLLQYLNGWDVTVVEAACDVNRDGRVNNKDLGILLQYLNGWDVELK